MAIGLIHKEINCDYKSFIYKAFTFLYKGSNKSYTDLNKKKEEIESEFSNENNIVEMTGLLNSEGSSIKRDSNLFIK